MKIVRTVSLLFLLKVLISCSQGFNQSDTYENYTINNDSWRSKKIITTKGDITYSAVEVPLEYYISKTVGKDFNKVDSIYNKNKRERILEVTFEHKDTKDLLLKDYTNKSYDDAVKYMAFSIKKDFTVLTSSNTTIACSGVNFERNFNVAPFKRIILYFNNIDPEDDISLIYQDQLFDKGVIKFNFTEKPLKL